jgi:eukaryotic-like serine/threonine-protein kinase
VAVRIEDTPRPGTLGDSPTPPANQEDLDHAAALVRMRRVALAATVAWTSGVGLDIFAGQRLADERLGYLLALRAVGLLVIAAAWARLRTAQPLSPRGLRALVATTFTLVTVVFTAQAAAAGGLTSPYHGGALLSLAAYGLVVEARWPRGARYAAPVALAYPATMLLAALVSPRIGAQLHDAAARAVFGVEIVNSLAMGVIVVVTGHVAWSLRRQVFVARSLGRYKLKRRIGAGGMGEVWVAYDAGIKRDVALKILRSDGAVVTPQAATRFEREVRATAELSHPNTVRVFDYGVTDDGLCYYVMELLEGQSLESLVARSGPVHAARAIHLCAQAARALAEAHGKGIVHRDVKPDNLMVVQAGGEEDFVKVLDFGIAKRSVLGEDVALTRTGLVVGTPQWMPPEAFAGVEASAATDVYALGATLYLLLTGAPPFPGASVAELVRSQSTLPPPVLPDSVPDDLAKVVRRCLCRAPHERYANGRELAEALLACADAGRGSGAASTKAAPARPAPQVDALGDTQPATEARLKP